MKVNVGLSPIVRFVDIAALNDRFRVDWRASIAVLLLLLLVAGRPLDQTMAVPRALLRYVGSVLGMPAPTIASLRATYQRSPTSMRINCGPTSA